MRWGLAAVALIGVVLGLLSSRSPRRERGGDEVATLVEAPEKEYPHSWESEARKIVDAFLGGGNPSFTSSGATATQTRTTVRTGTFEFTRGKPGQIEMFE